MNKETIEMLRKAVNQEIYAVLEIGEVGADGYTGNSKAERRLADKLWAGLIEENEQ